MGLYRDNDMTFEPADCGLCGQMLPRWDDIAAALDEALHIWDIPKGLRPMIIQAVTEIREMRDRVRTLDSKDSV